MQRPKVYILHENQAWTEPLERRLDALGTPYQSWFLNDGQVDLASEPPAGVFYSRMSASAHTRGHRFAPELARNVLEWLEHHGRRVLNGTRALRLEVSKVAQQFALTAEGIETPRTVAALGRREIVAAARQFEGEFIVKHNRGGKGLGVRKFAGVDVLLAYLDSGEYEPPVDGITLVQQYIRSPAAFITRCEFVGGRFLYALRVDTSQGFELCPADICAAAGAVGALGDEPGEKFFIDESFDSPLIGKFQTLLKRHRIDVVGIEFIVNEEGRPFTYDINTNTNYNAPAEARVGKYGMAEIATFLTGELARAYPVHAAISTVAS
ncbi:MAG: alpha-L-glutamate ligase [Gammaproteobacteria bacterium]|nr:alpha-L-glutamate ligase [Gammaproteobacteria bacterium]